MTDETAKTMVAQSTGVYTTTGERAALRCRIGDAIWAMRETIEVPQPDRSAG